MKKNSHTAKASVIGLSCALALSGMAPVAAFAAEQENQSTQLTLQYIGSVTNPDDYGDNKGEIEKGDEGDDGPIVRYTVPEKIPMAFRADGSLVCAKGEAYSIENKVIIDLTMTNVAVNPGANYTINGVDGSAVATKKAADLTLKFNAGGDYDAPGATLIQPTTASAPALDVDVPAKEKVALGFGGTVNGKVEVAEFKDAQSVGSLTWTINPDASLLV